MSAMSEDSESSEMEARRVDLGQVYCCRSACFLQASCPFTDELCFLNYYRKAEIDGQSRWRSVRYEVPASCNVFSVYLASANINEQGRQLCRFT
jgi:hypothetical protein